MGLLRTVFSNTRKPQGFWGKLMVAGMNGGSHAKMAFWGIDLGSVPADGEILDIGCGGGANLARLMKRSSEARVTGVDYSEVSAANYFWPDIENSFAEVRRVMVPGGKFLIVNEDDGLSGNNGKWEKIIDGMHTYTPDEVKGHLEAAGFKDIRIHRNEPKHWLAVTAIK